MVLYGWWYVIGVAAVVVVWLVYLGPAESRFWKRRIDLVRDRLRKKEAEQRQKEEAREPLDAERRSRRIYGRVRHRFIRRKKK